jgi:hypothetical protein
MTENEIKHRANPAYAVEQLVRALTSPGETAERRVRQWTEVVSGMLDGTLRPGSRTPVADVPAWVTLEVAHGGFATGSLAAGGPMQPHEADMLRSIEGPPAASDRALLNAFHVSDLGREELRMLLRSGRYRVNVPEEAALLVVSWLVDRGETDRAEGVLSAVAPFFDRLRFYPAPADRPFRSAQGVSVQPASDVVAGLRGTHPKRAVQAMKEAIQVWAPLYDRAVRLFAETVEGELPRLSASADGVLERREDGSPIVMGGWPCRRFAADWSARARALLADYWRERRSHGLCGKPDRPKENFARLRGYLAAAADDPGSLTGRDVGMIRKILASYVTSHGAPGDHRLLATRSAQVHNAARAGHHDLARILADRIEAHGADGGVPDLDRDLLPLSPEEASAARGQTGEPIPPRLATKALRCLEAPIETLIGRGIVASSEVMARLLPPLTAQIRASAIAEPELRRVYEQVYGAFRRRRSLLLLDLQSQVRLEELPWVAAVTPWVGSDEASRRAARSALVRATRIAIESFPQTILPNKLVRELRALAAGARLQIPLVDELAADIFMGTFSPSYARSAQAAAPVLRGTLYERYYDLLLDRVIDLDPAEGKRRLRRGRPDLAALCVEMAAPPPARVRRRSGSLADAEWSVARNGTIIEQAQILTTHNLAQLIDRLDLREDMRPLLPELARRCFAWTCTRQQLPIADRPAAMQNVKNCAYAWRQMILYLSLGDGGEIAPFLEWAADHLAGRPDSLRRRLGPALAGLRAIAAGARFGPDGIEPGSDGRRFLGWSLGRHWLLPEPHAPVAS